jgi:hypothetical protein
LQFPSGLFELPAATWLLKLPSSAASADVAVGSAAPIPGDRGIAYSIRGFDFIGAVAGLLVVNTRSSAGEVSEVLIHAHPGHAVGQPEAVVHAELCRAGAHRGVGSDQGIRQGCSTLYTESVKQQ